MKAQLWRTDSKDQVDQPTASDTVSLILTEGGTGSTLMAKITADADPQANHYLFLMLWI